VTLPLILSAEAEADFDSTFDWYELRRSGLGGEFASHVHDALDRIATRPESFPLRAANVRRALVRRYPYAIYYRIEGVRILVLAIVHTSRDQRVWRDRM
jgi:plasmid stabilization system protein ParE